MASEVTHFAIIAVANAANEELELIFITRWGHADSDYDVTLCGMGAG